MNNARETKSKKREGFAQRVAHLPFVFAMCFLGKLQGHCITAPAT